MGKRSESGFYLALSRIFDSRERRPWIKEPTPLPAPRTRSLGSRARGQNLLQNRRGFISVYFCKPELSNPRKQQTRSIFVARMFLAEDSFVENIFYLFISRKEIYFSQKKIALIYKTRFRLYRSVITRARTDCLSLSLLRSGWKENEWAIS